jgi:hypothetical protein
MSLKLKKGYSWIEFRNKFTCGTGDVSHPSQRIYIYIYIHGVAILDEKK